MRPRRRIRKLFRGDLEVTREEVWAYIAYEAGLNPRKPLIVRLAEELAIPADEVQAAVVLVAQMRASDA